MYDKSKIKVIVWPQNITEDFCKRINSDDVSKPEWFNDVIKNDRYAVVSITEPGSPDADITVGGIVLAIHRMQFYDVVTDYKYGDLVIHPASKDDVRGLKNFIDRCVEVLDVNRFIVHCAAGISRSAGCGAAIEEYLDIKRTIRDNCVYQPNIHVYKVCMEEFGINTTADDYRKLFKGEFE